MKKKLIANFISKSMMFKLSSSTKMNTNSSKINITNPSLCIPRVFNNITKERVFKIFAHLFDGANIERIDMVSKLNKDGQPIKRVFVHFKPGAWDKQPDMRESLINGKEVKIVYDDPWYWKCLANTGTKRDSRDVKTTPAPRVEIGAAAKELELPKPRESTVASVMSDVSTKTQSKKKKKKISFEDYEQQNSTSDNMKALAKAEVASELRRVGSSRPEDSESSSDDSDDEVSSTK